MLPRPSVAVVARTRSASGRSRRGISLPAIQLRVPPRPPAGPRRALGDLLRQLVHHPRGHPRLVPMPDRLAQPSRHDRRGQGSGRPPTARPGAVRTRQNEGGVHADPADDVLAAEVFGSGFDHRRPSTETGDAARPEQGTAVHPHPRRDGRLGTGDCAGVTSAACGALGKLNTTTAAAVATIAAAPETKACRRRYPCRPVPGSVAARRSPAGPGARPAAGCCGKGRRSPRPDRSFQVSRRPGPSGRCHRCPCS